MASGRFIPISVKRKHVQIFQKRRILMPDIKVVDYAKTIPTAPSVLSIWIKKYGRKNGKNK